MDILLKKREAIDLGRVTKNFTLKCLSGQIWVTCQGDMRDYLLKPGMEYKYSKSGKIVAYALTEASLCILKPSATQQEVPIRQLLEV